MVGVDYSASPGPGGHALASTRIRHRGQLRPITAVGRYVTYRQAGGRLSWKALSATERDGLFAAGLDIWLVFEGGEDNTLGGTKLGDRDGGVAAVEATTLRWPAHSCVYLACDRETTDAQLPTVMRYLDAARPHLRQAGYRIGVYGQYSVVRSALAGGHVDLGWQTRAWSGVPTPRLYQGPRGAALYQSAQQITINGVGCDVNEIWHADYGGYRHHVAPAPTAPVVVALQRAVHLLAVDGKWGKDTEARLQSVRKHSHDRIEQLACGLRPSGHWDAASEAAEKPTIKTIQLALSGLPHVDLTIDGVWGKHTEAAFEAARAAHYMKW